MKWPRYIIHADLNHCYAQIEEMKEPWLRKIPMAVGGDEDKRHGIILAKNDLAKKYGIKTAETLRDAYKKCPDLYIVHPHYDDYIYYTEKVKDIYREYSDKVESFGLDEAWIDISDSELLFDDPIKLAKKIQIRVYEELGLTVSMGISYNKIFAKLGSDMDKHMGFTVISPDNYQKMVYDLAVDDLLYVGQATKAKLDRLGIKTIGDLAMYPLSILRQILGKNGAMIAMFARGLDITDVKFSGQSREVKSISNGVTAIRDLSSLDDIRMIFWVLSESVASRCRDKGLVGDVIYMGLRDNKLHYFSRQKKIDVATDLAKMIFDVAMSLFIKNIPINNGHLQVPFRSITIGISHLSKKTSYIEYDLFDMTKERLKEYDLEVAIDKIRDKYGHDKACRLVTKLDDELTDFDPKGDHVIHPESWF